jgi:hypothetical protein
LAISFSIPAVEYLIATKDKLVMDMVRQMLLDKAFILSVLLKELNFPRQSKVHKIIAFASSAALKSLLKRYCDSTAVTHAVVRTLVFNTAMSTVCGD